MQADEIVRDAAREVLDVRRPGAGVRRASEFVGVVDDEDILRVVVAEEEPES